MNWTLINDSLAMARGCGFDYSVRKLDNGEYLVKQDSFTNGRQEQRVKTQAEGFALAERWDAR